MSSSFNGLTTCVKFSFEVFDRSSVPAFTRLCPITFSCSCSSLYEVSKRFCSSWFSTLLDSISERSDAFMALSEFTLDTASSYFTFNSDSSFVRRLLSKSNLSRSETREVLSVFKLLRLSCRTFTYSLLFVSAS